MDTLDATTHTPAATASRQRLLESYIPRVYGLCYRMLRDSHAAEEAVQETFLSAIKLWDRFTPKIESGQSQGDPRLHWLLSIAAYRSLRVRHGANRNIPGSEQAMNDSERCEASTAGNPVDTAEQRELLQQLDAALQALPDTERKMVVLHYVEGLTQADIARAFDAHPREVSRRIKEGVRLLRRRIVVPDAATSLTLAPLLLLLPLPSPPAGLAPRVLNHPAIQSWTATSAASAGAATAKGASTLATKLWLLAAVTALGVLLVVWIWHSGSITRAPGQSATPVMAQTPETTSGIVPIADTVRPPRQSPDSTPIAGGTSGLAQPPQPATPAVLTAAELEAAYGQQLGAGPAAARAAAAKYFSTALPPVDPAAADKSVNTLHVATSIGAFLIRRDSNDPRHLHYLLQMLAAERYTPYVLDPSRVTSQKLEHFKFATGKKEESDWISYCGRVPKSMFFLPKDNPNVLVFMPADKGEKGLLTLLDEIINTDDIFPASLPTRYDAAALIKRLNIPMLDLTGLEPLMDAARAADTVFVARIADWQEALSAHDDDRATQAGAAAYAAAEVLLAAQHRIAETLDAFLHDQDSGNTAWAMLTIGRAMPNPLALPAVTPDAPAKPPARPTHSDDSFMLDIHDETVANVLNVINKNPLSHITVTCDPILANSIHNSSSICESIEGTLMWYASDVSADCKQTGPNTWKLVPKPAEVPASKPVAPPVAPAPPPSSTATTPSTAPDVPDVTVAPAK